MADSYVRRMVASLLAEVAGAQSKRQSTNVATGADQSHLGVGLADLTETVMERRLRTIAVSGAALGDPRAYTADCPSQVLPAGTDPKLQGMTAAATHEEDKPIYLPCVPGDARSPHSKGNALHRRDEYSQKPDAWKSLDGENSCDKRQLIPTKPDTSSDGNGDASDDRRHKRIIRKISEKSKKSRRHRAKKTLSSNLSLSDSQTSDKEKKSSHKRRRRRSPCTDSEQPSSSLFESDDEQNRRSSRRHASESGSTREKRNVLEPLSDLLTNAKHYRALLLGQ